MIVNIQIDEKVGEGKRIYHKFADCSDYSTMLRTYCVAVFVAAPKLPTLERTKYCLLSFVARCQEKSNEKNEAM